MDEFGFFEYTCEFYDDIEKEMRTVHGVIFSDSFANAMKEAELYYHDIENIKIQGIEPCNIYEFEEGPISFSLSVNEKETKNG